MDRFDPRVIFGFLLLAGGVLAMLQTFGYLDRASDIVYGGVFITSGLVFLAF